MTTVQSAEQAASLVLHRSMEAATQGTFAVGGAIIENSTGRVIISMHNNVLMPFDDGTATITFDPTAHGERQLVYWYYENRESLKLPEPSELTVVTSLDPCAMCAGTLMTAGFNVGVVAIDDFAGINHDQKFAFLGVPPNLREKAKSLFGYYAAEGPKMNQPSKVGKYTRNYVGGKNVAFHDSSVLPETLMACGAIFGVTVNDVRSDSNNLEAGLAPGTGPGGGLQNPADLKDDSPIKQHYRRIYSKAFSIRTDDPRFPCQLVLDELERVAAAGKDGDGNAVALIDPFGNVVLCLPGREKIAPVYAPFMEVTQAYAKTKWALMNDPSTRDITHKYLTVPKFGTFLFLHAPDPTTSQGLMTLGAYGSTMEGLIPQVFPTNLQYVHGPKNGTTLDLAREIVDLPPFYTQLVQLAAAQAPTVIGGGAAAPTLTSTMRKMGSGGNFTTPLSSHEMVYRQKAGQLR